MNELRKKNLKKKLKKILNVVFFCVSIENYKKIKYIARKRKKSTIQSSKTLTNLLMDRNLDKNKDLLIKENEYFVIFFPEIRELFKIDINAQ